MEKLDLTNIRKSLQIQDDKLLSQYLKAIWADLSKRVRDIPIKGITKITFNKYYNLGKYLNKIEFNHKIN